MASFKFPPELLAIITSLSDRETLRALRLTNHLLCAFATKNLFFKFSLNTYDRTCEHLELIIAHPRLKKHVRKIYLNTVEDDYESDDDRLEVDLELPWKWKDVLSMLSKLPNLESVILRFDKNCSIGDNYGETPQSNEYRETIIKWLAR
ncbi:hypothetical protein PENVUL_c007G08557 [Penicillium vulpinum]|uniref:F-box domain-containing protein n=1 Tax=Penicillium vulpinum TaxID=29845 RepID=A0A1V6S509_9EURO|nr:hypothetical protein PENVUL_c007G08557 [Penicillium vulpinum]